jgi:hypothetical protein
MENIKGLNTQKLHEVITNVDLRNLKIITSALNIGVLLFFAVCLFLYFSNDNIIDTDNLDTSFNDKMLLGVLGITALMIVMSRIIPNNVFKKDSEAMTSFFNERASPVKEAIQVVTTYYIIKFALLEGAALFGLVSLMLSILNDAIDYNDIYWLSIIPMLVMNFIFILTFPTKERVIQLINDKILSQNF